MSLHFLKHQCNWTLLSSGMVTASLTLYTGASHTIFDRFQLLLLSNMAKMCMVDQRLLQMQLEAMQTMKRLLAEKAFTVVCNQ